MHSLYCTFWNTHEHIHPLHLYIRFPFIFAFFSYSFYDFFTSLLSLLFARCIQNITSFFNIEMQAHTQTIESSWEMVSPRLSLLNLMAVFCILMWCEVELRNCVASVNARRTHAWESDIRTCNTFNSHTQTLISLTTLSLFSGSLTLPFQYDFCQYSHWNFVSFRILLYIYVVAFFTCFFYICTFQVE